MEKEKLKDIVAKTIKEVWKSKESKGPLHLHLQESLVEALHQALSMSGVVGRSEQSPLWNKCPIQEGVECTCKAGQCIKLC
jgi:hypothetical protein